MSEQAPFQNTSVDGEIDLTMQHFNERPAANADGGDEVDIPDDVADQLDDLTDTQRVAVEAYYANPTASQADIVKHTGVSTGTVWGALKAIGVEPDWAGRARARGDHGEANKIAKVLEAVTKAGDDDDDEPDDALDVLFDDTDENETFELFDGDLTADENGETVAGTSADDFGDIEMQFVPDFVAEQLDDLTGTQRAAVEAYYANPIASQKTVADTAGVHGSTVAHALERVGVEPDWVNRAHRRGDHAVAAKLEGWLDNSTEPDGDESPTGLERDPEAVPIWVEYEDETESVQEIVELYFSNPGISAVEIADEVDCDGSWPGRALRKVDVDPDWTGRGDADDVDETDDGDVTIDVPTADHTDHTDHTDAVASALDASPAVVEDEPEEGDAFDDVVDDYQTDPDAIVFTPTERRYGDALEDIAADADVIEAVTTNSELRMFARRVGAAARDALGVDEDSA